jgi:hypothetical protein
VQVSVLYLGGRSPLDAPPKGYGDFCDGHILSRRERATSRRSFLIGAEEHTGQRPLARQADGVAMEPPPETRTDKSDTQVWSIRRERLQFPTRERRTALSDRRCRGAFRGVSTPFAVRRALRQ